MVKKELNATKCLLLVKGTQIKNHLVCRLVFASPLRFRVSNSSSVIDFKLVHEVPIVATAPEFKAVLDQFALHRLPQFRTTFKFDHALFDTLDSW
jgi:hypothetical protein